MKTYNLVCPECGAEFTVHHTRKKYCSKHCGTVVYERTARPKRDRTPVKRSTYAGYDPEELLCRPWEQQVEGLDTYLLAKIWGVTRDTAGTMKFRPWELTDTPNEVTQQRKEEVKKWLQSQITTT